MAKRGRKAKISRAVKKPVVLINGVKRGRGRPKKNPDDNKPKVSALATESANSTIERISADKVKEGTFLSHLEDAIFQLRTASNLANTEAEKKVLSDFSVCLKRQIWNKYVL